MRSRFATRLMNVPLSDRCLGMTISATTRTANKGKASVGSTMAGVLLFVAVAIVLSLWADRAFV